MFELWKKIFLFTVCRLLTVELEKSKSCHPLLYLWVWVFRNWVTQLPLPTQFRYLLISATHSVPLPSHFCYPLSSATQSFLLPTQFMLPNVWIFSKEVRGTREGASSLVIENFMQKIHTLNVRGFRMSNLVSLKVMRLLWMDIVEFSTSCFLNSSSGIHCRHLLHVCTPNSSLV